MIQKPYGEYIGKLAIIGAPNLVGADLWLSPGATMQVFDNASSTANPLGSSTNNGSSPSDTGLNIQAIVTDNNGNSWMEVYDSELAYDTLGPAYTGYVPMSAAAIPSNIANAYLLQSSVPGYLFAATGYGPIPLSSAVSTSPSPTPPLPSPPQSSGNNSTTAPTPINPSTPGSGATPGSNSPAPAAGSSWFVQPGIGGMTNGEGVLLAALSATILGALIFD